MKYLKILAASVLMLSLIHIFPNRRGALEEGIPSVFLAPFFEDVSELYFDGIDLTVDLTTVSYTHLDVYKRQVSRRPA